MRVVIVGAAGLLGQAVAFALAARGAQLLCTARDPVRGQAQAPPSLRSAHWVAIDLREVPAASRWRALLHKGDAVVNAAGTIRKQRPGDFDAIHLEGPTRLIEACEQAQVRLLVHISAVGASPDAPTAYFRSKGQAEERLRQGGVPFAIVRPSLVWSEGGASAGLFAALAVLPVVAQPDGGRQPLQPVHLDDLVCGVLALIDSRAVPVRTVAFVGARDQLAGLPGVAAHPVGVATGAMGAPAADRSVPRGGSSGRASARQPSRPRVRRHAAAGQRRGRATFHRAAGAAAPIAHRFHRFAFGCTAARGLAVLDAAVAEVCRRGGVDLDLRGVHRTLSTRAEPGPACARGR